MVHNTSFLPVLIKMKMAERPIFWIEVTSLVIR